MIFGKLGNLNGSILSTKFPKCEKVSLEKTLSSLDKY